MYSLEFFERLKQRRNAAPVFSPSSVSPVVWGLGITSLLTDISSEMISSILPAYLVLHLHMSPLQYGVIDGVLNGFGVAALSVMIGLLADRNRWHKGLAVLGYAMSAVCKLGLVWAGTTWTSILAVVGLDRAGKGIRTAPRDALISLSTAAPSLAVAFAVHRAMDACGTLLGPIIAFVMLAVLPGAFDAIFLTSFIVGLLGVCAILLLVPRPELPKPSPSTTAGGKLPLLSRRFVSLAGCGFLLAVGTVSDGFIYLALTERSQVPNAFFPLLYVLTAAVYMLSSIPAGRLADVYGRSQVLLGGYACLATLYLVLAAIEPQGFTGVLVSVTLLGLCYAATEGVLIAMTSAVVSAESRTSGIAVVATAVAVGKLVSSLLFGVIWQASDTRTALLVFVGMLVVAAVTTFVWLRSSEHA
jgi:MFS family permease